jgi:DNA polymerase-3 subunit epsilon
MNIIGVDLETTGLLDGGDHRIVELAVLRYHYPASRTPYDFWVQRFNPQRPIESGASAVHGITFEMVASEPIFDEKPAQRLADLLESADLVVAHNGRDFDLPFIEKELMRVGTALRPVRYVDTMQAGRWATPFGKVPSLKELCFATGVEYDDDKAHAADYDVDRMMQAFFVGLEKRFFTLEGEVYGE